MRWWNDVYWWCPQFFSNIWVSKPWNELTLCAMEMTYTENSRYMRGLNSGSVVQHHIHSLSHDPHLITNLANDFLLWFSMMNNFYEGFVICCFVAIVSALMDHQPGLRSNTSAIIEATKRGLANIVTLLLDYGVDPNNMNITKGTAALHEGVRYCRYAAQCCNSALKQINNTYFGWNLCLINLWPISGCPYCHAWKAWSPEKTCMHWSVMDNCWATSVKQGSQVTNELGATLLLTQPPNRV